MVVTLPVERARTGQVKPDLQVLGNGLVEPRALGMAQVVSLHHYWQAIGVADSSVMPVLFYFMTFLFSDASIAFSPYSISFSK